MDLQRFRGGNPEARAKHNSIMDEVGSLSKIRGDEKYIVVHKGPGGSMISLNVDAVREAMPKPVNERTPSTVRVVNQTGVKMTRYSIVVAKNMFVDATVNADHYLDDPLVGVDLPTAGSGSKMLILQCEIEPGAIGLAIVAGFCIAWVNVMDITHPCADVTAGTGAYMTSCASGPFTIFGPTPVATGYQWLAGKLGGGASSVDFLAVIMSSTAVIANRQWTYTVQKVTGKGAVGYTTPAWLTDSVNLTAYNTMEYLNDATSGRQGNGVSGANLKGLLIQPVQSNRLVVCRTVTVTVAGSPPTISTEYWFSSPNGIDGTCVNS